MLVCKLLKLRPSMRFFITIGGATGFALALASSLHAGNAPAYALRDGAVGCIVGAFLFRIMHRAFLTGLLTYLEARAEAIKQAQPATAEKATRTS